MPKQLTTQNATITTATIQVQAMTIGARQVTLSVFRQLLEEPLIADDGTLNGVPWGAVNYHPGKCSEGYAEHWHIVWQRGEELRRAFVTKAPQFEPLKSPTLDKMLTASVFAHLEGKTTPFGNECPLRKVDDEADWETADSRPYLPLDTRGSWKTDGIPWAARAHPLAGKAAALAQHAQREQYGQEQYISGAVSTRAELADLVAQYGCDLGQLWVQTEALIAAEAERRQRHRDVLATLAELPQLFIAV